MAADDINEFIVYFSETCDKYINKDLFVEFFRELMRHLKQFGK